MQSYILDSANARTTATVGGADGVTDMSGLPLGKTGAGEVYLKTTPFAGAGATLTPTLSSVSGNGTVATGKRYIEFIFSSDFAGTIGTVAFAGGTDAAYSLPFLPGSDVYAALAYTISAGSARLTTLV